jgi:hypothetical protein
LADVGNDADGDGIVGAADMCPQEAGLDPDGCPPHDTDGDQVMDRLDRCPDRAGPRGGDGCTDRDADRDGVVDRLDACADVYGHPSFDGCVPPDRDGDGHADPFDRCPDEPETWNGRRDGDGCKDKGAAILDVSHDVIAFTGPLSFHSDDRYLAKRGRVHWAIAVDALEESDTRAVRIFVVAEHGLSYGDSLQRAERRGKALRRSLARATRIDADDIEVAVGAPDGRRRIEITYR